MSHPPGGKGRGKGELEALTPQLETVPYLGLPRLPLVEWLSGVHLGAEVWPEVEVPHAPEAAAGRNKTEPRPTWGQHQGHQADLKVQP